jgi:hypothetical protein
VSGQNGVQFNPQRVSKAASIAIGGLEEISRSGRPSDLMLNYLADTRLVHKAEHDHAARGCIGIRSKTAFETDARCQLPRVCLSATLRQR